MALITLALMESRICMLSSMPFDHPKSPSAQQFRHGLCHELLDGLSWMVLQSLLAKNKMKTQLEHTLFHHKHLVPEASKHVASGAPYAVGFAIAVLKGVLVSR